MDDTTLYDCAFTAALQLPGSEVYEFARGWEAARVKGKWFLLATENQGQIITVKAAPDDVLALTEQYAAIAPGYHMNKKHWITLRTDSEIIPELIDELVVESYLLVVGSLPVASRPVDPATYRARLTDRRRRG